MPTSWSICWSLSSTTPSPTRPVAARASSNSTIRRCSWAISSVVVVVVLPAEGPSGGGLGAWGKGAGTRYSAWAPFVPGLGWSFGSSDSHSCHPSGGSGQEGSGRHPAGGVHPDGGVGHPGGELNFIPVPGPGRPTRCRRVSGRTGPWTRRRPGGSRWRAGRPGPGRTR